MLTELLHCSLLLVLPYVISHFWPHSVYFDSQASVNMVARVKAATGPAKVHVSALCSSHSFPCLWPCSSKPPRRDSAPARRLVVSPWVTPPPVRHPHCVRPRGIEKRTRGPPPLPRPIASQHLPIWPGGLEKLGKRSCSSTLAIFLKFWQLHSSKVERNVLVYILF